MPNKFCVEFTTHAQKDLSKLSAETYDIILKKAEILEHDPFPRGNIKKKIKGVKHPLFRLRINTLTDSFRLFYGIHQQTVFVLRIVSKKEADRILKSFRI